MTKDEFRPLFDRLHDSCKNYPDKNPGINARRYKNRMITHWKAFHEYDDPQVYEDAIDRYLDEEEQPEFPAPGALHRCIRELREERAYKSTEPVTPEEIEAEKRRIEAAKPYFDKLNKQIAELGKEKSFGDEDDDAASS